MENSSKEINELRDTNKKITYDGKEILLVLREIEFILISLHKQGSYYSNKDRKEYEKETTQFIDNSLVCTRLALIRRVLTEQFDLEVGDDGLDDIERACEDIMYWSKPGDFSNEIWISGAGESEFN